MAKNSAKRRSAPPPPPAQSRKVAPRWAAPTTLVVSAVGLVISLVLAYESVTAGTFSNICPANSTVDCAKVTNSPWSKLFGIPVSYLGVLFFIGMIVLSTRWAWERGPVWLHSVRFAGIGVGLVMVVYLVWAELFRIGSICLWCTGVHITTFILFAVVMFAWALREDADPATLTRPKSSV